MKNYIMQVAFLLLKTDVECIFEIVVDCPSHYVVKASIFYISRILNKQFLSQNHISSASRKHVDVQIGVGFWLLFRVMRWCFWVSAQFLYCLAFSSLSSFRWRHFDANVLFHVCLPVLTSVYLPFIKRPFSISHLVYR